MADKRLGAITSRRLPEAGQKWRETPDDLKARSDLSALIRGANALGIDMCDVDRCARTTVEERCELVGGRA